MLNLGKISLFLLISVSLGECGHRVRRIVGGSPAQLPPPDDPTVHLRFAGKAAAVKGLLDKPHYVFRGIRYADNPVGKDRFQRPRQHFLQGNVNATSFPPPCLQSIPGESKIIGSEDCLFLNVFTPDLPDGTEGLTVIVWIHGGGFRHGSASQYGVRNLVGKRIVVVSVQYRLGTLGFLSTGSPELPGNAGLWDMALAVQWVRNYIGFFGGNPHNIVVMGQGTGASSALTIALSKIARGSISAVVAMSGTAVSHWALENNPTLTAREIAEYHGCPTASVLVMLKCMQNLPANSIVEGDISLERSRLTSRGFVSGINGVLGAAPNAEGRFDGRSLPAAVEMPPLEDMTDGEIPTIPLLTGITRDETKKAVHGPFKSEIETKLKTIPNFLDKVLIKNLQSFTGLDKKVTEITGGLFNILDPLQFRSYVQIHKNNILEGLDRIAEATCDALFNLPAFLTADLWSKKSKNTFLYRFEHSGNARKGRTFLKGDPLVGNGTDPKDVVGHGDDLSYIFEARNIDGSPLDDYENLTKEDIEVRESFTNMIVDFAKSGGIMLDKKPVPPFSTEKNNFIQIGPKVKLSNDFKFCEMGLWAGLADRLKSKSCQFLSVLDSTAKNVENLFFDTVNATNSIKLNQGIQDTKKKISGVVDPLGLLGTQNKPNRQQNINNMIPPIGFLG